MKTHTPKSTLTALMALAAIIAMTACSPKPSAEETAAQNKALVEQAVEEAKKGMLAEQAAEKARQDAVDAAQAEEKNRQAAAVAAARREGAAEQRAAAARAKSRQSSSDTRWESNPPPAPRTVCSNCGVVLSINVVETAGKGSGLGVVAGGVVGGLLGNQVGKGSGQDVATVVGVVGGAVAGNAIEKRAKKTTSYDVTVRMDTGEQRVIRQATVPNVVSGEAVKIENDVIYKM